MHRFTLSLLLCLAAILPAVAASPFEEGLAAYKNHEYEKAYQLLKPIAAQDTSQSAVAALRLGHLAERGKGMPKDLSAAARWFEKAAQLGSVPAQAHLGRFYRLGTGVPRDVALASKWSIKAATQGNSIAETNLGYMALDGMVGPASPGGAAGWFQKAADQGDAGGMMGLATLYESGNGLPRDLVQARKWAVLASVDDGEYDAELYGRAKALTGLLAGKMTPAQIAQSDKLVSEFKPVVKR